MLDSTALIFLLHSGLGAKCAERGIQMAYFTPLLQHFPRIEIEKNPTRDYPTQGTND